MFHLCSCMPDVGCCRGHRQRPGGGAVDQTARPKVGRVARRRAERDRNAPDIPRRTTFQAIAGGRDRNTGIVPSLGAAFPAPPIPGPSPVTTDFAGAIKNTYVAIEPWVHYGFQLAQYAGGLGSVCGLARSSNRHLLPLRGTHRPQPGVQFCRLALGSPALRPGCTEHRRDSWNALRPTGNGRMELMASAATTASTAPVRGSADHHTGRDPRNRPSSTPPQHRRRYSSRCASVYARAADLPARNTTGRAAMHGLITQVEQALGTVGTEAASIHTAVTETAKDATGTLPTKAPIGVTSAPDRNPTNTALNAVLQAPHKAADVTAPRQSAPSRQRQQNG